MNTDKNKASNIFKKIRYDRIAAAILILIVFILIIRLIAGLASKKDNDNDKTNKVSENSSVSQITSETAVHSGGRIEFQKIYMNYEDIYKGDLLLVNDDHEYIFPEDEESKLSNLDELKNDYYKIKSMDIRINTTVAKALNSMMSGFFQEKSNKNTMITRSFISKEHQDLMYNQALENSKTLSKGGFSEHHTGMAIDIYIYGDSDKLEPFSPIGDYEWIKDNCAKYGFIQRYPVDKEEITGMQEHSEQFRYVGVPHAYYITENNLTLEEYIEELKKYTFGNKSLILSCYSKQYEIYFIKAKSQNGNVDVYVPSTNKYTISGNNIDGFIITVEK